MVGADRIWVRDLYEGSIGGHHGDFFEFSSTCGDTEDQISKTAKLTPNGDQKITQNLLFFCVSRLVAGKTIIAVLSLDGFLH